MKALSIKQPWAELILLGKKKIELRKWNTNFRGKFYIHASGNSDEEMMSKFNFKDLPRKMIIGEAELLDVKIYKDKNDFIKDNNKHLASTMDLGNYGFILGNVKRITPFNYRGQLNFFDVK